MFACAGGGRDPDSVSGAGGQREAAGRDQEEAGHHATQRAEAQHHQDLAGGHHLQRVRTLQLFLKNFCSLFNRRHVTGCHILLSFSTSLLQLQTDIRDTDPGRPEGDGGLFQRWLGHHQETGGRQVSQTGLKREN